MRAQPSPVHPPSGLESSSVHTHGVAAHRLLVVPTVSPLQDQTWSTQHFTGLIFFPALEELDTHQGQLAASFPKV